MNGCYSEARCLCSPPVLCGFIDRKALLHAHGSAQPAETAWAPDSFLSVTRPWNFLRSQEVSAEQEMKTTKRPWRKYPRLIFLLNTSVVESGQFIPQILCICAYVYWSIIHDAKGEEDKTVLKASLWEKEHPFSQRLKSSKKVQRALMQVCGGVCSTRRWTIS